jgi:polysaccharide pyruvyl transferase WcaK-like protein
VEVREVRDPDAVELLRQAQQANALLDEPDPAGLEPAPGRRSGASAEDARKRDGYQASSFSRTGVTGTT